jgi:hypothetical protein
MFAFLSFGFPSPGEIGRHAVAVTPPAMAFTAVDPDSDIPSKEYGLPSGEDEREGEEEDDTAAEAPGMGLTHPPLVRPHSSRIGFSIANRWVLGLGPDARVPYPRC